MTNQELADLYQTRVNDIAPYIGRYAGGDEDMKQIGRIAVFNGLQHDPTVPDTFLRTRAKWDMLNFLRRGRSVDGHYYQRQAQPRIVRFNHAPAGGGLTLAEIVSADDRVDPETLVIDKLMVEGFLVSLTGEETEYIRMKVEDGMSDVKIWRNTDWSRGMIQEMRRQIRAKISVAFAD